MCTQELAALQRSLLSSTQPLAAHDSPNPNPNRHRDANPDPSPDRAYRLLLTLTLTLTLASPNVTLIKCDEFCVN